MLIWIEDHPGLGSWVQAIAGLLAVLTALGIAVWESRRSAKSTRDALMEHPGIAEVFSRMQSLDMAVVSTGDLTPHSVFSEYGLLTRAEIASLETAGAVGDVLCHFIDAEGQVIDHPVNQRVMGMNPLSLRGTRHIVLASGGWQKLTAIRAALKLLRPTVLVVNELVAERLAAEPR